jgi:hypothetical protein
MVDKIVKLQGKVPFKTEAKGRLKAVVAGLLEGIVSQETLNCSVSAKALKRTVCAVIPPRSSAFGDRVRKGCCDMPEVFEILKSPLYGDFKQKYADDIGDRVRKGCCDMPEVFEILKRLLYSDFM